MSFSVALGLVLLTRGGQFSKFSNMLIGDLLSITPTDLIKLGALLVGSLIFLYFFLNKIILVSLNASLARSRGINVFLIEFLFAAFVSVVVSLSIPWVGLLVINSLLVLPAATSNNLARGMKSYLNLAIVFSVISSIAGLAIAYELSSATGATIVLVLMAFFILSLVFRRKS